MHFTIHRGAKEIGGSCVEVWTEKTRILVDFGMPLVEKDGSEFDFKKYKDFTHNELVNAGALPDIKGIYENTKELINGILISHPHQDHYGLYNYIHPDVKCYLGEATHILLDINNIFTPQNIKISNPVYFEKSIPFTIGDIKITPFWADHSAFDSYSFLIEADGMSIFYSGDFRGHGRKKKVFEWFTYNAPKNVEYLLLEGTTIGRDSGQAFRTEVNIENDLTRIFSIHGKSNIIYTSGQNIDRLVSIFRACIRSKKIMVVDVYVATILKALSPFAQIPYPTEAFDNLKVMFPYYTSKKLANQGDEKILYQFKNFKISKEEISKHPDNYVLLARPSMQKDLEYISGIGNGNFIYSMWGGYKSKTATKKFLDYFESRGFTFHEIHTSGHADIQTLKKMVSAIQPKTIVPVHTFHGEDYAKILGNIVKVVEDGERI